MDTHIDITDQLADRLQVVNRNEEKRNVYPFDKDDNIYDIIEYFLENNTSQQAFYIVDLTEIQKKYQYWCECLPNVQAYYAVKSNPDAVLISVLAKMGCGFDCASKEEIALALSDVSPNKIIYANPCKKTDSLQYARAVDVDLMTFDSHCELDKINMYHPDAKCLLRIAVDDTGSVCRFNCKFGCPISNVPELLAHAQQLEEIDIVGISWHVGSNCKVIGQFDKAFNDARSVYDMVTSMGYKLSIIDIGGGFPGVDTDEISFRNIAEEITSAISKYFGDIEGLTFIGEPGRFMCTSSHTLVNTIIGIKSSSTDSDSKSYQYTIDDTIYGSYNCIVYDYALPHIQAFNERTSQTYKSTIFGQSCDSMDKELNGPDYMDLPKLAIGDRIFVTNFGAYTCASTSTFNGFSPPDKYYIIRN
jgi:ornithine decarboxylase